MTVLGNVAVVLGLLTAAGSVLTYLRLAKKGDAGTGLARQLVKIHTVFLALASLVLLVQILSHDFANGYVFSYSDRSLPLHFLISSFYAGQEGSFLFWALCGAILALFLMPFAKKRRSEPYVMAVFMGIQTLLLLLIITKSPFRTVWQMFGDFPPGAVPADGRGLNPLLQNFWMAIHPPVLFVGFAAMGIPFAFAVAGLWKRQYDLLTEQSIPWVLFAVATLGLGIMLGGYWAYGVLGWGGYWGWDPVENSSLVPWLTGMALLHTLLVHRRTGKFPRTNYFLAIISFVLVLYSTFLTRSGKLGDASVHSFADPGAAVYLLLLGILIAGAVTGLGFLAARWNALKPVGTGSHLLTREIALGAGTLALSLSAAVILFGTSLPLFSTTSVEPSFYDGMNLPLAIAMGLLIGISLYLQWEEPDARTALRRSWKAILVSLAATVLLVVFGVRDAGMVLLAFASIFALVVNVDIAVTVTRGNWRLLGGKVAHIGVGVLFLGIIGSGRYSLKESASLPLNQPRSVLEKSMTYVGSRQLPDGKYAFDVRVDSGASSYLLSPVMFNAGDQGIMRNPDIASFAFHDVYLSPVSLEGTEVVASGEPQVVSVRKGEGVELDGATVRLKGFDMSGHGVEGGSDGMAVGAVLTISRGSQEETVTPVTMFRQGAAPREVQPGESKILKAAVSIMGIEAGMSGEGSSVTLRVQKIEEGSSVSETLVVEASTKPFISFVWAGTVLLMVGFALAIVHRAKEL